MEVMLKSSRRSMARYGGAEDHWRELLKIGGPFEVHSRDGDAVIITLPLGLVDGRGLWYVHKSECKEYRAVSEWL